MLPLSASAGELDAKTDLKRRERKRKLHRRVAVLFNQGFAPWISSSRNGNSASNGSWLVAALDYREAARLMADIARGSGETSLRQAAEQALPSLRNAALKNADLSTKDHARRRLSVIRNILYALNVPQFGKRRDVPQSLTPMERHLKSCLDCRWAAFCPASKSTRPISASPRPRIRTPAEASRNFRRPAARQDALMKER